MVLREKKHSLFDQKTNHACIMRMVNFNSQIKLIHTTKLMVSRQKKNSWFRFHSGRTPSTRVKPQHHLPSVYCLDSLTILDLSLLK